MEGLPSKPGSLGPVRGVRSVADPVHASAMDVTPPPADALSPDYATIFDGQTPFWRPGIVDIAKVLGWRWVILLPAIVLVVAFPFLLIVRWYLALQLLAWFIKLWVLSIGVCVTMFVWGVKNVVKARTDPFCIHCGYSVSGLGERGQCPECGRGFAVGLSKEYQKDPQFFRERCRVRHTHPATHTFRAGEGATPHDGT